MVEHENRLQKRKKTNRYKFLIIPDKTWDTKQQMTIMKNTLNWLNTPTHLGSVPKRRQLSHTNPSIWIRELNVASSREKRFYILFVIVELTRVRKICTLNNRLPTWSSITFCTRDWWRWCSYKHQIKCIIFGILRMFLRHNRQQIKTTSY